MSYPTKYTRQYDYVAYQNANPTRPLPATSVHADLNLAALSISEIVEFLKTSLRSDGAIANGAVGTDQLSDAVKASLGDAALVEELIAETTANAATSTAAATNAAASETSASASAISATSSASAAAASAANAIVGNLFVFDNTTTMADPGTGNVRFNNAALASVTAMSFDALSSVSGNPDVSAFIATWGASSNPVKGTLTIRKNGSPAVFATFSVTASVTNNTGWLQVPVAYVAGSGTFSALDTLTFQFTRAGDQGANGFANPISSIGLTATNGVATTSLRSDGAPALSQAIAPTWTGQHKFTVFPTKFGTSSTSGDDADSVVQINRDVDNTGSGNAHAFADNSTISRTTGGPIGYNSFDGRITVAGSGNFDHYAAFQASPTLSTSGTITRVHGTASAPTITAGTVTDLYHHTVFDTTGAGTVTNQYGYYAPSMTKGATLNYAFFSAGTTPSKFGGNLDVAGLSVAGADATGAWTSWTPTITSSSGSITTSSAKAYYKKIGKTVVFSAQLVITTNGTGAGTVQFTLPFTTATHANNIQPAFAGLKTGSLALVALGGLGSSLCSIAKYDGTYPATSGDSLYISGTYETD